jgi:hypothetical protein
MPLLTFPKPPSLPTHFPGQLRQATTKPSLPKPTASHSVPIQKASHLDISARRAKKNDPKHRKRSKKEDTSVTFEEMTRLMNTYGPIKCLRNRTNKNADKEIKAASILRKFYRWFPDFEGVCSSYPSLYCAIIFSKLTLHSFPSLLIRTIRQTIRRPIHAQNRARERNKVP